MWERVGYYLRAKVIVMFIVGVLTYASLILIGVPYALLLAILVALGEIVPRVGAWVARIPLLAIAALEGWTAFGLTALSSVLIQNLEGSIISPFVQGDQLDIHPLVVFLAVLGGAALLGPAGAFVAVPFAAMVQVFVEEVVDPLATRAARACRDGGVFGGLTAAPSSAESRGAQWRCPVDTAHPEPPDRFR